MTPRTLTTLELRWARVALETIYPEKACSALPVGVASLDVEGYVADLRSHVSAEAAFGIRVAIWIVAFAPVWVLGKLTTLGGLGAADRERVLVALLASRIYAIRQLVVLFKAIGGLLYGSSDAVRAFVLPEPALPQTAVAPRTGLVLLSSKRLAHGHRNTG